MDLLFKRYASPFILLDEIIPLGDLGEFVDKFWKAKEEDLEWQYFLHKVFDKSFNEFKESLKSSQDELSDEEIEATIEKSWEIAESFIPDQ